MSFFCFSAFCFCWAEPAGPLLSSFFCPVLESIKHTLRLPHTHARTRTNQCRICRRHQTPLQVNKRCSVVSTSRWHRHHTRCARFTPDMLKPRCVLRLYRPLGSALAVPSMAFPDGNTYPPRQACFATFLAAAAICPRPNLELYRPPPACGKVALQLPASCFRMQCSHTQASPLAQRPSGFRRTK